MSPHYAPDDLEEKSNNVLKTGSMNQALGFKELKTSIKKIKHS